YTSPIFGYGISAVTSADRFTYGTGGGTTTNAAPTVATAASAPSSTVKGKTTTLKVLGADDGGEANLVHARALVSGPTGALPTFSANGSNAAKTTTVTFDRAGTYTFQVTITDAGGLSTTSSVTVTVAQTLTSIKVSPSSSTVTQGGTVQLTATGYD